MMFIYFSLLWSSDVSQSLLLNYYKHYVRNRPKWIFFKLAKEILHYDHLQPMTVTLYLQLIGQYENVMFELTILLIGKQDQ